MIGLGTSFGICNLATAGVFFPKPSIGLYVATTAGDIVFENTNKEPQFFPTAQAHTFYNIAATRILTEAVFPDGNTRSTTAVGIVYCSTNIP